MRYPDISDEMYKEFLKGLEVIERNAKRMHRMDKIKKIINTK